MTEERKRTLDKAKKIQELAIRGINGEMDSAKVMLEKYMTKHNISEAELNGYKSSSLYFNMSDEEFLKEMLFEILLVAGVSFISKFGNPELHEQSKVHANKTVNKFFKEMNDRVNKKR